MNEMDGKITFGYTTIRLDHLAPSHPWSRQHTTHPAMLDHPVTSHTVVCVGSTADLHGIRAGWIDQSLSPLIIKLGSSRSGFGRLPGMWVGMYVTGDRTACFRVTIHAIDMKINHQIIA